MRKKRKKKSVALVYLKKKSSFIYLLKLLRRENVIGFHLKFNLNELFCLNIFEPILIEIRKSSG